MAPFCAFKTIKCTANTPQFQESIIYPQVIARW